MVTINFTVEDHCIHADNFIELAQMSNNFDACAFSFNDAWDGFKLYAVMFQDPKHVFKEPLDDQNTCKIKWDVLEPGWLYIGARGEKDDGTVATTMVLKFPVKTGAIDGNETGQEMLGQSQYEELVEKYNALLTEKADGYAYENGKFYLTAAGQKITEGIEFKTDLSEYLTHDEILQLLEDSAFIVDIAETETGFTVLRSDGETFHIETKGSGLSFDSGYQDEEGYLHLTKDGEDIDGFAPFLIAGGGDGSSTGSKLKLSMSTASTFSVLESAGTAVIKGNFSSVDADTGVETGSGNLSISVNGVIRENRTLAQGEFTVDVFRYLTTGSNAVKLVLTDSYGSSVTRNFTITKESFTLEWTLEGTVKNSGTLTFYVTPTGSGDKTIYVLVDGAEYLSQVVSTSGTRFSVAVADLAHGSHTVEVYGEMIVSGSVLESNHLYASIAQVSTSGTEPVIAVNWPSESVSQYSTISIENRVIDPQNNPASVSYLVNGVVYATEEHDQSAYSWNYRPMTSGTYTLGIRCGNVLEEKSITVTAIGSSVQEITNDLDVKIDPSVMTSLSGWSYGDYRLALSDGFDEINGGLQVDEEGVRCIKIIRGDRLTLNYRPFGTDARKAGKELKLVYKIENSTDMNAAAVKCESGGIGLTVRANDVVCASENVTIKSDTCEGYKTELDINIESDKEDRFFSIWESCSSFDYDQYPSNDNFTQASPQDITFGSDDCNVILYLFRGYSRSLTDTEIKANFFADGKDGDEIQERYNRNQIYDSAGKIDVNAVASLNPNLRVLTWHSDRFSLAKSESVSGTLTQVYVAGGAGHNWTAYMTVDMLQGTSSVGYAKDAGGNHDFSMPNGITLEDGTVLEAYAMTDDSIPVNYLNFKDNIASQEHVNNIGSCEWFNRFQPYIRPAREADLRVRDTVEGHMAVLFFHNTGSSAVQIGPDSVQPDETVFYGLGNLNNSKKNHAVFGQDEEDDILCIEILNNTADQARGKSDDLEGEDFSGDYNFDFRYKADSITEEEAKALFQELLTFIHASDYTAATNEALDKTVVYNGQAFAVDSAAYRQAKWKAEAGDHFQLDSMFFHQVDTEVELARDNRVKNVFPAYSKKLQKWHFCFAYDRDTIWCINNEAVKDIDPGHLESDAIGTKAVFNGADCVIWVNNRAVFADELRAMYLDRESAGAWDMDAYADYLDGLQEQVCEALWIEDMNRKDKRTLTEMGTDAYTPFGTGRKRLHRRKAMKLQGAFMSSYYKGAASIADSATVRGYTPTAWTGVAPSGIVKVTAYCNLFINVRRGSEDFVVRVAAGETAEINLGSNLNDTEIYFRDAQYIQGLGDLSGLYIGFGDFSALKRCRRFEIGSDVEGYVNTNFTGALFTNCAAVESVNLNGCQSDVSAYDFSNNLFLEEFHCKGTGVTGVTFAKRGRIQTAELNAVTSLFMNGLTRLETLTLEAYDKLTSLTIEDCPAVDSYTLAKAAVNLARVRMLDLVWSVPIAAYDVLMRLDSIQGIDDDGYNTDQGVLTGNVYFTEISETKYNKIVEAIPEVTFTYGEKLEECTVTFQNTDGTVLYVAKTEKGGSVQDPITAGLIAVPTQASTVETGYTFYKWDTALDYIVGDTVITATYMEYTMVYNVQFVDKDGTALESYQVEAHGSCRYQGADLERTGYVWIGWDQETTDIIADMVVTAVYIYPTLPSAVLDMSEYDYAYSDDPNDNMAYTFSEFYAIVKTGQTATYFPMTTKIKMALDTDVIKDTSIVFNLHSIGHYELADGSGKMSNADFYMVGALNATKAMNSTATNVGGWDACTVRKWLNETLYPELPPKWRNFIVKTITLANAGDQSTEILASEDYLRYPSIAEMGFNTTAIPYKNEISEKASEVTFSQYTDNSSRIKKTFNGEGTAVDVNTRSAVGSDSASFCAVNYYGTYLNCSAGTARGSCWGFSG